MNMNKLAERLVTRMALESAIEQAPVAVVVFRMDGSIESAAGSRLADLVPEGVSHVSRTCVARRWDTAKRDAKAGRTYSVSVEDPELGRWTVESYSALRSPSGRVTGVLLLAMVLPEGTIRGVCDVEADTGRNGFDSGADQGVVPL